MEETLGKRIMAHRKRLGLTQDQLAEKLGVTAQAVSKWENDQSCPDITTLPKLAALFGTTTDALLGHEPVHEAEVVPGSLRDDKEEDEEDDKKENWEISLNPGRRGSLTFGIFVLLLGLLMVLDRVLQWDAGFWSLAWPSALLVFGFASMVHRFRITNLVCTLLGGCFLVNNIGLFAISVDKSLIFPSLVVLFGVSLLIDAFKKPKNRQFHIHHSGEGHEKESKSTFQAEGEYFSANLAFGEATRRVSLPRLAGGNANVSFGELIVDLCGCGEIADGCSIEAAVSFGSMTILVPRCYRVQSECDTAFAGLEFEGHPDPDPKGTVYISGGASFGALTIHYV